MISTIITLIVGLFCYICIMYRAKDKEYKTYIGNLLFKRIHPYLYLIGLCITTWIIVIKLIRRLVNYVYYH
jgi:uncharacterized protein YggT (Ycf19 family)